MSFARRVSRTAKLAVALCALLVGAGAAVSPAWGAFGISAFDGAVSHSDGEAYTQAGGHPYSASTTFQLNRSIGSNGRPASEGADLRNARIELPPGLIGNPQAMPQCPKTMQIPSQFQSITTEFEPNAWCPLTTIVGLADVTVSHLGVSRYITPVFNLVPPPGMPAQFGFAIADQKAYISTAVRSDGDYGITVTGSNISEVEIVLGAAVTLWGVPADHSHDDQRCMAFTNLENQNVWKEGDPLPVCNPDFATIAPHLAPHPANIVPLAFLTNPTACTAAGTGLETKLLVEPWNPAVAPDSASFISHRPPGFPLPPSQWGAPQGPTDCKDVPFDPAVKVEADTRKADSPSGLSVEVSLPQKGLLNDTGVAPGHLKRATVTLPDGWSVSPSAADGLMGCSDAQSRVGTLLGAECPEASKIGTVEATTPLLEESLTGGVYVGTQESSDPTSGKMFRMFLALNNEERGIRVKLPGQVRVDPSTGRIETTFDNNPQVPVERILLRLKGGPRAPLATPLDCGAKHATAELESWSGAVVTQTSDLVVDCPGAGPLRPSFKAGVTSNLAGRHTSFLLRVERPDRQQVMDVLALRMPAGLLAKLRGVPRCGDAAADAGVCPESSRVGTVTVGAGPGVAPYFLSGGVYLTGPYKSGPFGLAVAIRAKAGPFDLGTVVVRQQLIVDPIDAHVDVVSDPLPTILKGVPIRLRSLNVDVDRKEFILNPTSCAEQDIVAAFRSSGGSVFATDSPFGVANCTALPLKPKLRIALTGRGQTTDGKHPGVKATVTQRRGDANLKRVRVELPLSLALDPENAQALCEFEDGTRVDPTCPKGSIVGRARAVTPILDRPLTAPVYFVKNMRVDRKSGRRIRTLPMLVIPLRGENGIKLNLKGISSVSDNRLVSTFATIPDAPVSRFDLAIKGGKNGILAVSGANICRGRQIAEVDIDGQNHKTSDRDTALHTPCSKKNKRVRPKRD